MKRAKYETSGDDNQTQPYLSGAYIRTFVKQLTSSRTMREKVSEEREGTSMEPDPPPPSKPHKKQVRRRLQTRKPYQEKLLNMAEARREIVTALKLHRAAMKEANQNQIQSTADFQAEQKSRRNPRIYASNNDAVLGDNNVVYCSWPVPSAAPPPPFREDFDFALPSQALGLNLNLQDFVTIPSSTYSSSSPSTSSSPLPPAAEICSNCDPRAKKFEFLNFVEKIGGEDDREEELTCSPFDEVMEFPPWLSANESCFEHVPDYFQAPVLPCMDFEEIEGMDGDWLA